MKLFKKVFTLTLALLLMFSMMVVNAQEAEKLQLFVATNGTQSGDGSIDSPFKTIEQARDKIRELKKNGQYPAGGVVVNIREGVYRITETISLTAEDSGIKNAPVVYRGYMNEKPVITGAVEIKAKPEAITDEKILKKLDKKVADKIKQINLSEFEDFIPVKYVDWTFDPNPKELSGPNWTELIINGEVGDMSKYPDDMEYLDAPSNTNKWTIDGYKVIENAEREKELFIGGPINSSYQCYFAPVEIEDSEIACVDFSTNGHMKHLYKVYNSPAFISQPGEYCIDQKNKVAYVYPAEEIETIELTGLNDHIITLQNTENMIFRNLEITGGNMVGIQGLDVSEVIVDGCYIHGFPISAVNLYPCGMNSSVRNCHIYDIGKRAVNITGGSHENLTSCEFTFFNNEVHNLGRIQGYQAVAIWTHHTNRAIGAVHSYNKVYDSEGPSFGGIATMQIVEHNEVFDVTRSGEDQGMLYFGYDFFTQFGATVRNNFFHDAMKTVSISGHGLHGIYSDGSTGAKIYNNVVANVSANAIQSTDSGLHEIYNNVLIGRGDTQWSGIRVAAGDGAGYTQAQLKAGTFGTMPSYIYEGETWKKAFPDFVEAFNTMEYPYRTSSKVYNNLLYKYNDLNLHEYMIEDDVHDNWSTTKDPGFVDLANGNYQLKENAEVFKKIPGFEMIDMSKIGLASEMVDKRLGNGLALKINSPLAYKGGKTTMVDSANADMVPTIIDGRTLMPVRFISESFNADVQWNGETREVTIVSNGKTIKMKLDNNIINVDGAEITMDVPAQIINDRTFVPLRAIAEALGKKVFWDPQGLVIIGDKIDFDNESEKVEIQVLLEKMNQF